MFSYRVLVLVRARYFCVYSFSREVKLKYEKCSHYMPLLLCVYCESTCG
jgi:hypothetical protein